jgi:hypothetical protein
MPDSKEVIMTKKHERRPRGASPYGDFDHSKQAAQQIIDESSKAQRRKTEALRAQRLANKRKSGGRPRTPGSPVSDNS